MHVFLIAFVIFAIIGTNGVFAQDILPQEKTTKTVPTKMDSALDEVSKSNQSGSGIPSSINPDSIVNGNKIRVVIEFNTNNYTIPDNLGIEVETTYENMVQALVPIGNLEELANNADVRFIRMSYGPVSDQDILPQEKTTKTVPTKMDSALDEVSKSNQSGSGIPSSINPDSIVNGNKIRVVIEFNTNNYTIPDNLGIEVETTYENMVQALVPIGNLEELANNADVRFIRMSYGPVNEPVLLPPNEKDPSINAWFFLLIIPIVIILLVLRRKKFKVIF
jgi:hypothetical protein